MTAAVSFRAWLRRQEHRDDPVGDLARDAADDRMFPHVGKLDTIVGYLLLMHACHEAVEAARVAHAEWRAS